MRWIKRVTLVMIAGLLLCLGGCQKSLEDRIQEQLELGQRYLIESAYEEAIVAFSKVIELDAKNIPAYMGLGQVYEKQADQTADAEKAAELYSFAAENYEKVRELNPENMPAYEALVLIYRKLADYTKLFGLIEMNSENSANQDVADTVEAVGILNQLEELCETEKYEEVSSLIGTHEFEKLNPLRREDRIVSVENGTGVGVYVVDTGENMVYYGDYQGGLRQGHGVWIGGGSLKYRAEGEWNQDMPNGYQEEKNVTGSDVLYRGTVENGLWDGTAVECGTGEDGNSYEAEVSFTNGMYNSIGMFEDGEYYYYKTDDVFFMIPEPIDTIWGILGYGEVW